MPNRIERIASSHYVQQHHQTNLQTIKKCIVTQSAFEHNVQHKRQLSGHQVGMRVADQYNDRASSRLNPAENAKAYIKGIVEKFLGNICIHIQQGIEMTLLDDKIQFLKRQHLFSLKYSIQDNHLTDFILLPDRMFDSVEEREKINILAIVNGFICGALETMSFRTKVIIEQTQGKLLSSARDNSEDNGMGKDTGTSTLASSTIFTGKTETILRIQMEKDIKNDD